MRIASADEVRAAIAGSVLGAAEAADAPGALGEIRLHLHQREGLERVRRLLDQHGGALLADDVGLGKTFIALGVARGARETVVIAPAALRDAWHTAARRADVTVRFLSVEGLGRRDGFAGTPDLVIVDEAHHLRSPATKRFAAACSVCRNAKVLLLSATPVQNTLADLRNILALFLGERAHAMSSDEMARYIVRRVAKDLPPASLTLPRVALPKWVRGVADVDCLDRLLALAPAVPPADGDDGGALLTYTIVRQWSSSRAALRSALQRRLARARAMEDAMLAGRLPSRMELTAWRFAEGAQQLTFPELTVQSVVPDAATLLDQVRRHAQSVRELLAWLETSPDPDRLRAKALVEILHRHPGERVVAFSEYADTVTALFGALAARTRAAMLTHDGGRVAGGAMSRRELIERFAPGAASRARASERIDLLLTTDVLSEGVNLQDASIVVHLDLAWNPARLEQRVGRLRRLGAARERVAVYMFAPPAPAERLLQLERRLRLKLGAAARSVGLAGVILPGIVTVDAGDASAPREERIVAALRDWRIDAVKPLGPVAGAARSSLSGALACVRIGGVISLAGVLDQRVTDERATIERLIACGNGESIDVDSVALRSAREQLESWFRRRVVSDVVHLPALRVAHSRRALLRRVDTISRRAPRQAQPQLAPLMRAARTAATAALSAGAELVLDELTRAPMGDEAWLHAVGEFAALHARGEPDAAPQLLALLLLRSD